MPAGRPSILYGAVKPSLVLVTLAARTICTRTGRAAPSGGGGANGRSAYACTTMLPLLIDGSPLHTTLPLMLFGASATCASNVTDCPCDSTWNCVPREFGSVQTWPVFSITTTW